MRDRDAIDELTESLRHDTDPVFVSLRALLQERGVDPGRSLLLDFFVDDWALYFGLLVSQGGRAIQFDLDVGKGADAGRLARWEDITESPPWQYAGLVEAGLCRLEDEGGVALG